MSNNDRYKALDGLRGVAATIVVLHHCWRSVRPQALGWLVLAMDGPFSILNAGHFAVILFFVLSGFVLALPFARGERTSYLDFAVKRLCRLYPPAIAAVLVATVLFEAVSAGTALPQASDAMLKCWSEPISPSLFIRHLALAGYPAVSVTLDSPLWSLIVELRISFAFPLLVMLVRRSGWASLLVGILASYVCGWFNTAHGDLSPYTASTFTGSIVLTIRYFVFFIFGINIALYLRSIQAALRRIPIAGHIAICAVIYLAIQTMILRSMDQRGYGLIAYGAFASYLIACCTTFAPPARVLQSWLPARLGALSFPLYLIHVPVMMVMLYILAGLVPVPVAIAISLPAMLIAALAMERTVFAWSAMFGRRVTAMFSGQQILKRVATFIRSRLSRIPTNA